MQRILLALDGSPGARRALETAAELAVAFRATLSVVSVVPLDRDGQPLEPWDGGEARARDLREARRLLAERGITVDLLEPLGDPAPTIERIAAEGGFDTIVIGTPDGAAIDQLALARVPVHVMTHTSATVVVTH
jgi:nucleotide-binding universal stress UspA family protein